MYVHIWPIKLIVIPVLILILVLFLILIPVLILILELLTRYLSHVGACIVHPKDSNGLISKTMRVLSREKKSLCLLSLCSNRGIVAIMLLGRQISYF